MQNASELVNNIAKRLETYIIENHFKPGQALPSERQLVQRLAVSRSALREALQVLRTRGLIRTEHGKGSFVQRLLPANEQPAMLHLLRSQPRTLYDLLEVREVLESESARLAAERGTLADYAKITRCYEALKQAELKGADIAEHARLDHAFHLAICEASHNPVLLHLLDTLNDLMLQSVFTNLSNLYHQKDHKKTIDRHHARLYHAVTQKLPRQAHRAAQSHLQSLRAELLAREQENQRLVREPIGGG